MIRCNIIEKIETLRKILQMKKTKNTLLIALYSILAFVVVKILYIILIIFVKNEYSCEMNMEYENKWSNTIYVSMEFKNATIPLNIMHKDVKISFRNKADNEFVTMRGNPGNFEKGENFKFNTILSILVNNNNEFINTLLRKDNITIQIETSIKIRLNGLWLPFWKKVTTRMELKLSSGKKSGPPPFCIEKMDVNSRENMLHASFGIRFANNILPSFVNIKHDAFNFVVLGGDCIVKFSKFEIQKGNFSEILQFGFVIDKTETMEMIAEFFRNTYTRKSFSILIEDFIYDGENMNSVEDKYDLGLFSQIFKNYAYNFNFSENNESMAQIVFKLKNLHDDSFEFDLVFKNSLTIGYFSKDTQISVNPFVLDILNEGNKIENLHVQVSNNSDSFCMSFVINLKNIFQNYKLDSVLNNLYSLKIKNLDNSYLNSLNIDFNLRGYINFFNSPEQKQSQEMISRVITSNHDICQFEEGLKINSLFNFGVVDNSKIIIEFDKGFKLFFESEFYTIQIHFQNNEKIFISNSNNKGIEKFRGNLNTTTSLRIKKAFFDELNKQPGLNDLSIHKILLRSPVILNNLIRLNSLKDKATEDSNISDVKFIVSKIIQKCIFVDFEFNDYASIKNAANFIFNFNLCDEFCIKGKVDSIFIQKCNFSMVLTSDNKISIKSITPIIKYQYNSTKKKSFTMQNLSDHICSLFITKFEQDIKDFSMLLSRIINSYRCRKNQTTEERTPVLDSLKIIITDKFYHANINKILIKAIFPECKNLKKLCKIFIPQFFLFVNSFMVVSFPETELFILENGSIAFNELDLIVYYNNTNDENHEKKFLSFDIVTNKLETCDFISFKNNDCFLNSSTNFIQIQKNKGRSILSQYDNIMNIRSIENKRPDESRFSFQNKDICLEVKFIFVSELISVYKKKIKKILNCIFKNCVTKINCSMLLQNIVESRPFFKLCNNKFLFLNLQSIQTNIILDLHEPTTNNFIEFQLNCQLFQSISNETSNIFQTAKTIFYYYFFYNKKNKLFHKFTRWNNIVFAKTNLPFRIKYTSKLPFFFIFIIENQGYLVDLFPKKNVLSEFYRHSIAIHPVLVTKNQNILSRGANFITSNYHNSSTLELYICVNGDFISRFYKFERSFKKLFIMIYSVLSSNYYVPSELGTFIIEIIGIPSVSRYYLPDVERDKNIQAIMDMMGKYYAMFLSRFYVNSDAKPLK